MQSDRNETIIEAMLFAAGNIVRIDDIAEILCVENKKIEECIININSRFNTEGRPVTIRKIDNGFQMCTKPEYHEYIKKMQEKKTKKALSQSAMETLAIIAYKQPITKIEIEKIRGVSSDYAVSTLMEFGLIEDTGRINAPGRPLIYSTTDEFLRTFGYSNIKELPDITVNKQLEITL